MSYPKKVALFIPWSKAMVQGASVGTPDYGKSGSSPGKSGSPSKTRKRRRRRRRKKKHAQD